MYKATVNGKKTFEVSLEGDTAWVDGKPVSVSKSSLSEMRSHWMLGEKSMNVEVVTVDAEKKEFSIKVNNRLYQLQLKDRFDDLLKSLGMEAVGQKKVSNIKAPMPGLVLNILVGAGDQVEKDTPLLILEAMKMENVIKSPAAGIVKNVLAVKGVAVEKGAVLIEFR
ncbi:MAG: acetyl-CoA carboxylase biotin carboxyl carrier protein subunit [Flavobacteriales bacterium]